MIKRIIALAALVAALPTLAAAADGPVPMNDDELDSVTAAGLGLGLNIGTGLGVSAAGVGTGLNLGAGLNVAAPGQLVPSNVQAGFGAQGQVNAGQALQLNTATGSTLNLQGLQ